MWAIENAAKRLVWTKTFIRFQETENGGLGKCISADRAFNPLRPNNDLSQTSHCNIKGVSVSEVMRIENKITQVKFY